MEDLIRRSDAIKAVEECLKLLARPRYTVKTAIEAIPSVDIPHSDDWEKYSDKLWKNAYERGKADRPQGEWSIDSIDEIELSYGGTAYEPVYKCSHCGRTTESYVRFDKPLMPEDAGFPNFCGWCGARMKGADDETD